MVRTKPGNHRKPFIRHQRSHQLVFLEISHLERNQLFNNKFKLKDLVDRKNRHQQRRRHLDQRKEQRLLLLRHQQRHQKEKMENHAVENGAESHVGQIVKLIDQNQKFKLPNSKLMHLMEIQARFRNSFQNWIFPSLEPVKFLRNLIIFDNDFLENYQKVAY